MTHTLLRMSHPRTRADHVRQSLLLGPGIGLIGVGLVSLLRQTAVISWTVLASGLALVLAYVPATVRARRVAHIAVERR